jgi:hypothetical protein
MKPKSKLRNRNAEANKAFIDEVAMPIVMTAATLMFVAIILDYGFQLIEAIEWLTL